MNKSVKKCWVEEVINGVPKGKRQTSAIRLADRYFRLGLHYNPLWVQKIIYGVHEGIRHASAVRLVGWWYAKGLFPDEVKLLLISWNADNTPPMQVSEIKSIFNSTIKWAKPFCTHYLSDKEVNKLINEIEQESNKGGKK